MKPAIRLLTVLVLFAASLMAQSAQPIVVLDSSSEQFIPIGQTVGGSYSPFSRWSSSKDYHSGKFEAVANQPYVITFDSEVLHGVTVHQSGTFRYKTIPVTPNREAKQYTFTPAVSGTHLVVITRAAKEAHAYTMRIDIGSAAPATGGAPGAAAAAANEPFVAADYFPKFPLVPNHPDVAEAEALLKLYSELAAQAWAPAHRQSAAGLLTGGKVKGNLFCETATGTAEIKFTADAKQPAGSQAHLVRVKDVTCAKSTEGLMVFANGSYWLGAMKIEKGNLIPSRTGSGVLVNANGEAYWGSHLSDGRLKVAFYSDAVGNALKRLDETLPSSKEVARVRLIIPGVGHLDGETQNMMFQSQSAGTFTSFDGAFKTSSEIKAYPITTQDLQAAQATAVIFRFTAGQPADRPAIALALEGLTRIDTTQNTDLGPAGTYLFHGRLKPGLLSLVEEVQPAPGTLAKYSEAAAACALKPEIPVSWLLWKPDCKRDPGKMEAWSVDGKYRLTFSARAAAKPAAVKGKPVVAAPSTMTVLETFDPQQPGRAIAEWRAASFTTDNVPAPIGSTEMWRDGILAYRGPFKGLSPNGAGICGIATDNEKTEKCIYADGQRVDAIYLARAEQIKIDAAFSQREAAADNQRRSAAEQRAQLAREAAEQKRQLAAAQQRERQQKGSGLFNAFLGAALQGMAGSYGAGSLGGGNALTAGLLAGAGGNAGALNPLQSMLAAGAGGSSNPLAAMVGGGNPLQAIVDMSLQKAIGTSATTLMNNPNQAMLDIANKAVQQKTGTTLTTMAQNPLQATMEMSAKAASDSATQAASQSAAAQVQAGMRNSSQAGPPAAAAPTAGKPPVAGGIKSTTPSQGGKLLSGIYATADTNYQVEVKFNNGQIILIEPNKTSLYKQSPRDPKVYEFLNEKNQVWYGLMVTSDRSLEAFKPDPNNLGVARAGGTPLKLLPGTEKQDAGNPSCKAKPMMVAGQAVYGTRDPISPKFTVYGHYPYREDNGRPGIVLNADGSGYVEMHAQQRGDGQRYDLRGWWIKANCDGTPIFEGKTEHGEKYTLIFMYDRLYQGQEFGLAQLGVSWSQQKMYIWGERVKNLN